MCLFDPRGFTPHALGVSRRQVVTTGLVAGAVVSTLDWGKALVLPGIAEGAETPPRSG
jgi:mannitol/fructose-specific phosphotransferase system IIA component